MEYSLEMISPTNIFWIMLLSDVVGVASVRNGKYIKLCNI